MIRVKICGITSLEDALHAVRAGADALGFVFYEKSPRHISVESAAAIIRELPPFVQAVGLFVNAPVAAVNETADRCRLDIIQLHGDESPDYCDKVGRRVIKAFRVRDRGCLETIADYRVAGVLLDAFSPDAYGGTGLTFNWAIAAEAAARWPVILAGGLTPENVSQAVAEVAPYGVDVSSGVEQSPGRKAAEKVFWFINRAKGI